MFARSRMYARDGREMQTVAGQLLGDLCYLDDRDEDARRVREDLDRYGKHGVQGPFVALFGQQNRYVAEVASVYAEHFWRLGYLDVENTLAPLRWRRLITGLRKRFEEQDVRRSEVEETYGSATLVVDRRVLCYASAAASDRWVFFDCWSEATQHYVSGEGRYAGTADADPLIRSVRCPADSFDDGLILTLYGKVLRWGTGWWIRHPSARATEDSQEIGAQLRDIEDHDPST
jgi:hypothetical protein